MLATTILLLIVRHFDLFLFLFFSFFFSILYFNFFFKFLD